MKPSLRTPLAVMKGDAKRLAVESEKLRKLRAEHADLALKFLQLKVKIRGQVKVVHELEAAAILTARAERTARQKEKAVVEKAVAEARAAAKKHRTDFPAHESARGSYARY